ncbi:hypothetical protein [[Erwinia] mediterraneensis]|uniref:hypothetical protein n=1 Tax=[Erwinia] mediterraneensis TaxID=2161819 RepID=UPI0010324F69|nr:hypothetical protein [[Erwinia] mediterraneensis]
MYEAKLKVALNLIIISENKKKHKKLRLIPSDNSEIEYLIPGEIREDQAVAIKMVPKRAPDASGTDYPAIGFGDNYC